MRRIVAGLILAMTLWGCQPRTENPKIVTQVMRYDVDAVNAYLGGGGDPNLRSRDGDPLLYLAASSEFGFETAKALIGAGADVDGVSSGGRSVLHNAASWCAVDIVALLLANGADVRQVDNNNVVVLDVVCKQPQAQRDAVLNLLLGSGN